jgi:hypothetical protein
MFYQIFKDEPPLNGYEYYYLCFYLPDALTIVTAERYLEDKEVTYSLWEDWEAEENYEYSSPKNAKVDANGYWVIGKEIKSYPKEISEFIAGIVFEFSKKYKDEVDFSNFYIFKEE